MEVLIPLVQKGSINRATKAVKNMIENLQQKSKLIKIADKSPPPEYLSDDLASRSEDDKTLKAAEASALRKQKIKVKNNCFFFSTNQHTWRNNAQYPKFLSQDFSSLQV